MCLVQKVLVKPLHELRLVLDFVFPAVSGFKSPYAAHLLTAGLVFEVIGFLLIWRIAKINV